MGTSMASQPATRNQHTFATIQALRFVAALMVVFTHATFYIGSRTHSGLMVWDTGAQGVHVFFVISGFVMAWTARPLIGNDGAFRYFLTSRIIRIVPLYWTLNILKIVQIALLPTLAFVKPDVLNIVLSMLFVPSRNAEGAIEAFYGVGWTLNFEMFFYVVFAVCLLLRVRVLTGVTVVMLGAAALAPVRAPQTWPAITYLFQPMVLNFVWGLLIAEMYARRRWFPASLAVGCIVVGFLVIFSYPAPTMKYAGLQYAMVVWGCVCLEDRIGALIPRWLVFGGDASYSLYLLHPMVGVVVAMLLGRMHIGSVPVGLAAIALSSVIAAACVYWWFERPVTRLLRSKLLAKDAGKSSSSAAMDVRAPTS
jgi:exopolysaccharide production protein ExoZ